MTVTELLRQLQGLADDGKGGFRVDVVTRDGADVGPLRDLECKGYPLIHGGSYVDLIGSFELEEIEPE